MFPMRGSFGGPGGNLEFEGFGFDLHTRLNTMNKKRKKDMNIGDGMFLRSNSMIFVKEGKVISSVRYWNLCEHALPQINIGREAKVFSERKKLKAK